MSKVPIKFMKHVTEEIGKAYGNYMRKRMEKNYLTKKIILFYRYRKKELVLAKGSLNVFYRNTLQ